MGLTGRKGEHDTKGNQYCPHPNFSGESRLPERFFSAGSVEVHIGGQKYPNERIIPNLDFAQCFNQEINFRPAGTVLWVRFPQKESF